MSTILVPTDFSGTAHNASIYATELAKELQYDILLYHSYNIPIIISPEMTGTMMVNLGDLEQSIISCLKEEANFLTHKTGVKINYKTTPGPVLDEIVSIKKKQHPSLIVMGLGTTGPVSEFIFGSTAKDVLRKIHIPLIIVPEQAAFKKIKKMVFTNDYNVEPDQIMEAPVKEMIKKFNSQVYVLNILNGNKHSETDKKHKEDQIESYFDNNVHSYHYAKHDDVINGINEFIDQRKIDMVTMIPHKHNLFEKLFNESFPKKMAFHTHVPLLSLPYHHNIKYLNGVDHLVDAEHLRNIK